MDLSVKYMGLKLNNPIIAGSSGITNSAAKIKKAADAGAGAVILKSLFEEQLRHDKNALIDKDEAFFWYPEAVEQVDKFPKEHGVKEYIKLIEDSKNEVDIPVLASINCVSPNEWTDFAKEIENAGADGIELNIGIFPFTENVTSEQIEQTHIDIVKSVKSHTKLPVAVKIGPFFTNMHRITSQLDKAGADAIVMFNRFYQPDIHINRLSVIAENVFSNPEEITRPLRWISLLSNRLSCDLGASTGIHDYSGAVKHLLAGATTTQLCSCLYLKGVDFLTKILDGLQTWMIEHKFNSINEFKGLVANKDQNVAQFERVQFMRKTTGRIV